jgi:hypothetical protein
MTTTEIDGLRKATELLAATDPKDLARVKDSVGAGLQATVGFEAELIAARAPSKDGMKALEGLYRAALSIHSALLTAQLAIDTADERTLELLLMRRQAMFLTLEVQRALEGGYRAIGRTEVIA